MEDEFDLGKLRGGVAVITGSASGLGYALAEQSLHLGMCVVLSDLRVQALEQARKRLLRQAKTPTRVTVVPCDVTSRASVERLLHGTQAAFPGRAIQFVGANAGVLFPRATVLAGSINDWEATYRVNVLGIVHTLQVFVPVMVAQPCRSVVEITASVAGCSFGANGPYGTSKQAALGIAEAVVAELKLTRGGEKLAVVALCPALVTTNLLSSSREVTRIDDARGQGVGAIDGTAAQIEVAAGAKGTGDGKRTDDAGIRMSSSQVAGFGQLWRRTDNLSPRHCAEQRPFSEAVQPESRPDIFARHWDRHIGSFAAKPTTWRQRAAHE